MYLNTVSNPLTYEDKDYYCIYIEVNALHAHGYSVPGRVAARSWRSDPNVSMSRAVRLLRNRFRSPQSQGVLFCLNEGNACGNSTTSTGPLKTAPFWGVRARVCSEFRYMAAPSSLKQKRLQACHVLDEAFHAPVLP